MDALAVVLTPDSLTATINLAEQDPVAYKSYLDRGRFQITLLCSDKVADGVTVVVQLEPAEPTGEDRGVIQYSQSYNSDRLIYVADTVADSTVTLVNGGGSMRVDWTHVKAFHLTATNIPAGETVEVLLN